MVRNANNFGTLSDLRLITACLLGFSGFLRFNELINLRPCDCSITEEMLKICMCQSKTDQLHQGSELLIARTSSSTCPVAMLECYMDRTSTRWNDECFLFCLIQKSKKREILRQCSKISYFCLRNLFNKKLNSLGFAVAEFGLHSLRVGGATAAANAGIPDTLFKCHGSWRSENAKDGYIKDNIDSRLEVSKNLGLYLLCYSLFCDSK